MPFSQTSLTASMSKSDRWSALGAMPGSDHRLIRVLLLVLGLLGPLNLPFSIPPLGADAGPGWFGVLETKDGRNIEAGAPSPSGWRASW
jgi:hypothetical protein